ncbi:MAG: hypothetical protein NTZ48_06590 [Candidatus Omnitrophica bacterium]|nr:hypothetical protein [Candidatus Omnitrophota bacterium]
MNNKLKVYECRRYQGDDYWLGCLIVAAEDKCGAWTIFYNKEDCEEPIEIIEIEGLFATGEERVLYNDYSR